MGNRFPWTPHQSLGVGAGLRPRHYREIDDEVSGVRWFEAISENYMFTAGRPLYELERIAERFPIVLHGVALSIGQTGPIDFEYLAALKRLRDRVGAKWVSDHLCWSGIPGRTLHDLLPLPYDEATLDHVVERLRVVQDYLEAPILLENPSTYLELTSSTMSEAQFLAEVAVRADAGILLDVNNVYVNVRNHGGEATSYFDLLPKDRIGQIHVAGHSDHGTHLVDTHEGPTPDPVMDLLEEALVRFGPTPTLLEWDTRTPPWSEMEAECARIEARVVAAERRRASESSEHRVRA